MKGIEKRGENSYRLIAYCGYNKQGKQIRKTKTIDLSHISPKKQMAEAEKQRILFEEEIKKGQHIDNEKITFEEFIEKWLTTYANHNLQPKTLLEYKRLLGRIIPALGHIKLIQLQPTHFMEFYNNLRENGIKLNKKYVARKNFIELLSKSGFSMKDIILKSNVSESVITNLKRYKNIQPYTALRICDSLGLKIDYLFDEVGKDEPLSQKTILHHHRLISTILNFAVQCNALLINPALRIKAPKVEKKEARHFTPEQTEYILELIENEPLKYRVMITLAIYGGMRQGELTALTWGDIDFTNNIIRINKSLQHLPDRGTFIKGTKTESSRLISIPKSVMTLLKEYKVWQNGERANLGDLWYESNSLFTTIYGKPIFPSTISKWFLKFIRLHNENIFNANTISKEDKTKYILPEVNFHGLRHTNASLLIAEHIDIVTVSKRLGHSKTSTTTDLYAHALEKCDVEASNKLENLFNKSTQNKKQG